MLPVVTIDARDGYASQLRGWGRYARCLAEALGRDHTDAFALDVIRDGAPGPEVVFEQLALPLLLRRRRAALIHATNCFLPLIRSCPGVVTVHDLAFETWPADFAPRTRVKYQRLGRAAVRSAQRVICPSEFTRADVIARWGVPESNTRVVPEAPALPLAAAPATDPAIESPYVLAVGDLRAKKNVAALVRAFVALRRTQGIEHRLVLAGLDSGAGATLHALSAGEPVQFTGYVSDERLDALIRGADVLVHPSLYEGFGLVVLEAMARGTPVLAARATALPETGGGAAAYFDPAQSDGLEGALGALLNDAGARADLARRGLAHAAQYTWERTAAETAAVYGELL